PGVRGGPLAVRAFRLDSLATRRHHPRGHGAEGAVALRHRVRLHVAVVILARPDIAARPFERRRHHVVDQAMLIGDAGGLELRLELVFVNLLEDILETTIIYFEDRVLGREIYGVFPYQSVIE